MISESDQRTNDYPATEALEKALALESTSEIMRQGHLLSKQSDRVRTKAVIPFPSPSLNDCLLSALECIASESTFPCIEWSFLDEDESATDDPQLERLQHLREQLPGLCRARPRGSDPKRQRSGPMLRSPVSPISLIQLSHNGVSASRGVSVRQLHSSSNRSTSNVRDPFRPARPPPPPPPHAIEP